MSQFNTLPASAVLRPTPFELKIPNDAVDELKLLLKHSKVPPDTYENTQEDRRYGVTTKWIREAKARWENNFDWRAHEAHINSFPHYISPIVDDDGTTYNIHFVALFSQKPDAIPIVLLHGWPGSFLEFLPILDKLRTSYTPATLPYHLVVPSLPGYTFSSPPPVDKDLGLEDVARLFDKLARGLGFENGYVVQGGDIGSIVARIMAATYPSCKAIHINFCIIPEPAGIDSSSLNDLDKQGLARTAEFSRLGSAYALTQATKPGTIGIVLSSNPLALLAWIGEKFLAWNDEDPPLDTILESVTLYWFTDTISRAFYPYRQLFTPGNAGAHSNPIWYINKPFGFSWFPKELGLVPRSWAATTGNLVFFRRHSKGGHFAALECPEVLLKDLEEFVAQVWNAVTLDCAWVSASPVADVNNLGARHLSFLINCAPLRRPQDK
ncbi:putative epoxide hydrolase [Hypsizygus marmoreus]|uniref:Epoxide hydrolase n=1 Tax=Hypsizygus marmoreus TaxID=39966 RepID=A0A369K0H6_HYPMA|nr:putative epoxide hydrolase [Hypsizygus marmoreus]